MELALLNAVLDVYIQLKKTNNLKKVKNKCHKNNIY